MTEKKEKKSGPPFLNVRGWLGYDQIKSSAGLIKSAGKQLFSKKKAGAPETFKEAMSRLNLTEADLKERMKFLRINFIAYVVLSLGLFVFGVVELFSHFGNAILLFALAGFVGVLAYKQSFWMYQIKHRRLGCTFKEWRQG